MSDFMGHQSRIFVAGHNGLVGSAICRELEGRGYSSLIKRNRDELDLRNYDDVRRFFEAERPEFVFLAAAKVGGIQANNNYPAEFIFENLQIQTNVIHSAYESDVSRLLFLGSSCIYPKLAPQPLKEEYLLSGYLEPTNRPYAVAKIAGIEQCWSYNRQYRTSFLSVMPTNLYGTGDNFDLESSHVIPALIRKFHEAKSKGQDVVSVWGSGKPKREFLYSDDMAKACVYLMNLCAEDFDPLMACDRNEGIPPIVNIGTGEDISISELAALISDVVGFQGVIEYDSSKPDGTPRKVMDVSRLSGLGWTPQVTLRSGLEMLYEAYRVDNRH